MAIYPALENTTPNRSTRFPGFFPAEREMGGRDPQRMHRQSREPRKQQAQQHLRPVFPLKRLQDHAGGGKQQDKLGAASHGGLGQDPFFAADHTDADEDKQAEDPAVPRSGNCRTAGSYRSLPGGFRQFDPDFLHPAQGCFRHRDTVIPLKEALSHSRDGVQPVPIPSH